MGGITSGTMGLVVARRVYFKVQNSLTNLIFINLNWDSIAIGVS